MPFQRDHLFVRLVLGLGLQLRVDLLELSYAYHVRAGVVVVEYFHRDHSSVPVLIRNEFLTYNISQSERELISHLGLPTGREIIQYPSHRASGVSCVKRGEDKMPRLGGHQSHGYRLRIAHFTDEYYVRVLPEHFFESLPKRADVPSDFTLRDHCVLLVEQIFDRVFKRNYPAWTRLVDPFDKRGDRRAFSRTGDPGKKYKPV